MCEEGGRSRDLEPFCVNSAGNSTEPMKLQDTKLELILTARSLWHLLQQNRQECSGGTLATIVEARQKLEYDERVKQQ